MRDDERLPLLSSRTKTKRSATYYRKAKELEDAFAEDDMWLTQEKVEESESTTRSDNILSRFVLVVNVFLLIAKAGATYLSEGSSLSIISTLLDSIVDITSGIAIWYATYAIMNTDIFKYPRGRENLENMSIIFIAVVMGMANFYVVFQSVSAIIAQKEAPILTVTSLALIATTVITKAVLWIICMRKGSTSSLVLAIDQRNDVLTNIVAIGGAVLSQVWTPYADPVAATIISGYVVISWAIVIADQMPQLTGVACTQQEYARVLRVCIQHSPLIRCLDALIVYHTGQKVRVEAHVVLDPATPSKIVHDEVVEPLKTKLERLPFVDRAFVHPDYECDGAA